MGSYGSLSIVVSVGTYGVLIGHYRSLLVLIGSHGFLLVLIFLCRFLWSLLVLKILIGF